MSRSSFVCGETMCKQAFEVDVRADKPWPIRCPACNRSLYPEEVLQSTELAKLDEHRGPLMRSANGKLVPVRRADLRNPAKESAAEGKAALSLLDQMIEDADQPIRLPAPNTRTRNLAIAAIALILVAAAAWLATHR